MRKAVLCSAGLALALVLTDHVLATGSDVGSVPLSVNRAVKSDSIAPATTPVVPAATVRSKSEPAGDRAKLPEGCETGVSPLAKSAAYAPAVRCLS